MRTLMLVLVSSILLTACVDLSVDQQLYHDGTVDMHIVVTGDEKVLAGFTEIPANPAIADRYTYTTTAESVTYSFSGIPAGSKLFESQPGEQTSFFGVEEYAISKKSGFPFTTYTYTLTPGNALPSDQSPQATQMMSAIKLDYTVHTFGKITETNGEKLDSKTVHFTIDPTSTAPYTIVFRTSFWTEWFS